MGKVAPALVPVPPSQFSYPHDDISGPHHSSVAIHLTPLYCMYGWKRISQSPFMPGVLGKGMKTRVECPTDTLWMRGKDMSFANFVTQIASLLEERGAPYPA